MIEGYVKNRSLGKTGFFQIQQFVTWMDGWQIDDDEILKFNRSNNRWQLNLLFEREKNKYGTVWETFYLVRVFLVTSNIIRPYRIICRLLVLQQNMPKLIIYATFALHARA